MMDDLDGSIKLLCFSLPLFFFKKKCKDIKRKLLLEGRKKTFDRCREKY
jgi:hypothetical protein